MTKEGIEVRVVKTFDAIRTPCPPAGTLGEWYDVDGDFYRVRFKLPLTDKDGTRWLSHGGDEDFMRLKFLSDEIELAADSG